MARGKRQIDPGMAGKRKITDFLARAPTPTPTSALQPLAEEPSAKRRVSCYQLRYRLSSS
jgi:hypothetical protein